MSDSTTQPPKQDIRVVAADLKRIDKNGVRCSFSCYFPDLDLRLCGCLWCIRSGQAAALAAIHELDARGS